MTYDCDYVTAFCSPPAVDSDNWTCQIYSADYIRQANLPIR